MMNIRIAVVGVSRNKEKYGYKVFMHLINKGYEVYGINPNVNVIEGKKIYKSIEELPIKPEIVVFVTKPEICEKIMTSTDLSKSLLWFQPGSESDKIKKMCESKHWRCIFHKCIMKETNRGHISI